jgi:glycosyltransferase involved in cell wall biosynthesis
MPGKLVFIAYSFPPVTTGSAPRCLALARCLPEGGWSMIPVVAPNPAGLPIDKSILALMPREVLDSRVMVTDPLARVFGQASPSAGGMPPRKPGLIKLLRSLVRLYVLIPDKAVMWSRRASAAATMAAREARADLIMSFGPPNSCHLAGLEAARRTGLPLVAHFGDLWLYDSMTEWQYVSGFSRRMQRRMEARLVREATGILTTSASSSGYFSRTYGGSCPPLFHLHNGYDPLIDKPADPPTGVPGGRFLLACTGFFMGTQTPEPFLRGMRLYLDSNPSSKLHFQIVGQIRDMHAGLPRQLGLESRMTITGQVPHSEALEHQRHADALLVLVPPIPGSEVKNPSKLSEYLLARRPILGVCCRGELTEMIESLQAGYTAEPEPASIRDALAVMEADWSAGRMRYVREMDKVASLFDMRIGCRELGRYLDSIVGGMPSL